LTAACTPIAVQSISECGHCGRSTMATLTVAKPSLSGRYAIEVASRSGSARSRRSAIDKRPAVNRVLGVNAANRASRA